MPTPSVGSFKLREQIYNEFMHEDHENNIFILDQDEQRYLHIERKVWPFSEAEVLLAKVDRAAEAMDISLFPDHARRQASKEIQEIRDNLAMSMRGPIMAQIMGQQAEAFLDEQTKG